MKMTDSLQHSAVSLKYTVGLSGYHVQILNHLVDIYRIQYGGAVTEVDLNAIPFNSAASTIPKWRMYNFSGGCKTCTSHRPAMKFCKLIDLKRMNNFNEAIFVETQRGGGLKLKFVFFYGGNNS
jgi:hypothetical protein